MDKSNIKDTVITCQCPQCNNSGISVASINNKESYETVSHGGFNGTGLGASNNGIMIGTVNGSTTQRSKQSSKRAAIFTEPEPLDMSDDITTGVMTVFFGSIIITYLGPFVFDTLLKSNFHIDTVCRLFALLLLGSIPFFITNIKDKEKKFNRTILPKMRKRYNKIRYCENCNILFDSKNRFEYGDEAGFHKMMNFKD